MATENKSNQDELLHNLNSLTIDACSLGSNPPAIERLATFGTSKSNDNAREGETRIEEEGNNEDNMEFENTPLFKTKMDRTSSNANDMDSDSDIEEEKGEDSMEIHTDEECDAAQVNPPRILQQQYAWEWGISSDRKPDVIEVSSDRLKAARNIFDQNKKNPALLASQPLTRENPAFRVQVSQLGKWIGVGVADLKFQLCNSSILGSQTGSLNSSYFCQKNCKLRMNGVEPKDAARIHAGDTIDVAVDFDHHAIFYWLNDVLQGYITSSQHKFEEGTLFPCVNLSLKTEVVFRNADMPSLKLELDPSREKKQLREKIQKEKMLFKQYKKEIKKLNQAIGQSTFSLNNNDWRWANSADKKADAINVSPDGLTAGRSSASAAGKNPAVLATSALNKAHPNFRVQVKKLGKWIGIGIADSKFKLNDSVIIGGQTGSVNCGYFCQKSYKIHMMNDQRKAASRINESDTVDVAIDFDNQNIFFWLNEQLQGYVHSSVLLEEDQLFPCVNISSGTEVVLKNNDKALLYKTVKETQESYRIETEIATLKKMQHTPVVLDEAKATKLRRSCDWTWSNTRKAVSIQVDRDGVTASRPTSGGSNPSVMSVQPLSRQAPNFRVQVTKLGNWIGIGVADQDFVLDGSSVLGSQTGSVNSSYFCQTTSKIRVSGGETKKAQRISVNDIVDAAVDFDNQCIYYWLNEQLQGVIDCSKQKLVENQIFPCVCLSSNSEVVFRNDDKQKLYIIIKKEGQDAWKWDTKKKAAVLKLDDARLSVARPTNDGRNPAAMTTQPLTRANPHYRVQVKSLGNWIGIGVADLHFQIQDNVVLGSQPNSINSSYFCQNSCKIRMHGEDVKDAARIAVGDIVDVAVDFDNDNIFYWLNEKLQGHISCKHHILPEGQIYPCINLASGTEVVLRDSDSVTLNMPIEKHKEEKKKLIDAVKRGKYELFTDLLDWASEATITECKSDMLYYAITSYKEFMTSSVIIPTHSVPVASRTLMALAHRFDSTCILSSLPREILSYIFSLGEIKYEYKNIIQKLLIEGANPEEITVNSYKYSPFEMVCELAEPDLVKLFYSSVENHKNLELTMTKLCNEWKSLQQIAVPKRRAQRVQNILSTFVFLVQTAKVVPPSDCVVSVCFSKDLASVKTVFEIMHGRTQAAVPIDTKVVDSDGYTALMAASKTGSLEVVEFLLEFPEAEDVIGMKHPIGNFSAKDFAKEQGHLEVVKILKRFEDQHSKLTKIKKFFGFKTN